MVNNNEIPQKSLIYSREDKKYFTLKDLAKENTSFWKFSQSYQNQIFSYEANHAFIPYIEGNIVSAKDLEMGLSFVRAGDIGRVFNYGDQLTKFCFDINNEDFRKIMYSYAADIPIIHGEIKTCNLLVEKNYSLSNLIFSNNSQINRNRYI